MKNKTKKLIAVICIALLAVFACACNTSITVTPTVTPMPTPTPEPVQQITPSVQSIELYVGEQISTEGLFSASFGGFSLSASDILLLKDGTLTASSVGKGYLTATGEITSGSCAKIEISVIPLPEKTVTFSAGRYLALKTGETQKLSYNVHQKYSDKVKLSASGNITLNASGAVTGDELGFGVVTATIDGEYAGECLIIINDKENLLPISSIPEPEYVLKGNELTRNEASEQDTAVIMLTGDIMCLSAQQNLAKKNGKYDFSPSFKYVKPYFDTADFVIGNLETTLSVTYPYANQAKNVDGKPNCNAQSTLLDALRYAGYDAVVTANNHSLDANELGVYQTLERLEYYKIASTGTFSGRENRFILANINGIRVAFLSYTEIMNKRSAVSTEKFSQIIGEYSKENVRRDCAAAREAGAEFIIAYMHWGKENTHDVTDKQMRQAKEMANAGVDMIAGSHPHCLQKATTVTTDDGREVLCIYSLGNFVSSMGRDINKDTVILRLELERTPDGVKMKRSEYLPCKVSGYDGHSFVILPCNTVKSNSLKEAEARIDSIFNGNLDKMSH